MTKKHLFRNAGIMTIGALISRVLGFARETIVASKFGTSAPKDAYEIGSYIPITLSNLLVAGIVSAVFIPLFTRYVFQGKKADLKEIIAVVIHQFSLLMFGVMILFWFLAPLIVKIQAPGFDLERLNIAIKIFQISLPSVYFLGLAALCSGTLNSIKIFGIPTLGGILFNAVIVGFVFYFGGSHLGIYSIAYALVIGSLGQFLIQYIWMEKHDLGYRFVKKITHPVMHEIYGLVLPVLLGSGVNYLAPFIERFFGSSLPVGMISALGYAFKVANFPIGIFALAISAVVFPSLSENIVCKDKAMLEKNLAWAMKFILLIIVPATFGLLALSTPITRLLFQYGKFTAQSTVMTSNALSCYTLALVPWSLTAVLVKIFYSHHDTKTPVYVALITICILFMSDAILVRVFQRGGINLGYVGLALGSAIAAFINVTILWVIIQKKFKCIKISMVMRTFVITISSSLLMLAVILFASRNFTSKYLDLTSKWNRAIEVMGLLFLGCIIYSVCILLLDRRDLKEVMAR
jgi:putative peptidoglycan lipid II flippase